MRQRIHVVLQGLVAVLLLGTAGPLHAAEPLSLDELVQLVEAGVGRSLIEYQVQRTGLDFEIDVDAILALRTARADDALIRFLMDTGRTGPEPPATITMTPENRPASNGIRVIRRRAPSGRETLVLTNMSRDGRPISGDGLAPLRGIISSSTLPGPPQQAPAPARADTGAAQVAAQTPSRGLTLPSTIDVLVRHADDGGGERVRQLEDRLASLEQQGDGGDRPPVGAALPRHAINDQRSYPIVGPWGYPVLVPFAILPQEFRVHAAGPFRSFTTAARGGFNAFAAPPPCQRGQACSVVQRLAHP